jgi:hypothetical protein
MHVRSSTPALRPSGDQRVSTPEPTLGGLLKHIAAVRADSAKLAAAIKQAELAHYKAKHERMPAVTDDLLAPTDDTIADLRGRLMQNDSTMVALIHEARHLNETLPADRQIDFRRVLAAMPKAE